MQTSVFLGRKTRTTRFPLSNRVKCLGSRSSSFRVVGNSENGGLPDRTACFLAMQTPFYFLAQSLLQRLKGYFLHDRLDKPHHDQPLSKIARNAARHKIEGLLIIDRANRCGVLALNVIR